MMSAEDYTLLLEARERLAATNGNTLSFDTIMKENGITEEDLANAEEPNIE